MTTYMSMADMGHVYHDGTATREPLSDELVLKIKIKQELRNRQKQRGKTFEDTLHDIAILAKDSAAVEAGRNDCRAGLAAIENASEAYLLGYGYEYELGEVRDALTREFENSRL